MSFLVYLFVLLVAAGSVIFGLDWTQAPLNPPPYAQLPTQTAAVNPAPAPAGKATRQAATAQQGSTATVKAAATRDVAKEAQARATDASDQAAADQTETTAAVPRCNIAACSASYQSFRAADCTYQPYDGPRRVCTKTNTSSKVVAAHPRRLPQDERRVTDRREYRDDSRYRGDNRGGWTFDLFGGGDYDR